jgi:ribosomal protein L30E
MLIPLRLHDGMHKHISLQCDKCNTDAVQLQETVSLKNAQVTMFTNNSQRLASCNEQTHNIAAIAVVVVVEDA